MGSRVGDESVLLLKDLKSLFCLIVPFLLGGQRSIPPSQTWSAHITMETDSTLRASQRSVCCVAHMLLCQKTVSIIIGVFIFFFFFFFSS